MNVRVLTCIATVTNRGLYRTSVVLPISHISVRATRLRSLKLKRQRLEAPDTALPYTCRQRASVTARVLVPRVDPAVRSWQIAVHTPLEPRATVRHSSWFSLPRILARDGRAHSTDVDSVLPHKARMNYERVHQQLTTNPIS